MGVLVNESIELVCEAQGIPTPTIQWLKDGEAINNTELKGLRYLNVHPPGLISHGSMSLACLSELLHPYAQTDYSNSQYGLLHLMQEDV